jgi:hypothetical protein
MTYEYYVFPLFLLSDLGLQGNVTDEDYGTPGYGTALLHHFYQHFRGIFSFIVRLATSLGRITGL